MPGWWPNRSIKFGAAPQAMLPSCCACSALHTVGSLTASPSRGRTLREHLQWITETAERTIESPHDRARFEQRVTQMRHAPNTEPILGGSSTKGRFEMKIHCGTSGKGHPHRVADACTACLHVKNKSRKLLATRRWKRRRREHGAPCGISSHTLSDAFCIVEPCTTLLWFATPSMNKSLPFTV